VQGQCIGISALVSKSTCFITGEFFVLIIFRMSNE